MSYRKLPFFRRYAIAGFLAGAALAGSIGLAYAQNTGKLSPEECERSKEVKEYFEDERDVIEAAKNTTKYGGKFLEFIIRDPLGKVTVKAASGIADYILGDIERINSEIIDTIEKDINERCPPESSCSAEGLTGDTEDFNNGFKEFLDQKPLNDLSGEAEKAWPDFNPKHKGGRDSDYNDHNWRDIKLGPGDKRGPLDDTNWEGGHHFA